MTKTKAKPEAEKRAMTIEELKDYPYVLKLQLPPNRLSGEETKRVLKGLKKLTGAEMAVLGGTTDNAQLWIPVKEVESANIVTVETKPGEVTLGDVAKVGKAWFGKFF